jgi:hypothetical protein
MRDIIRVDEDGEPEVSVFHAAKIAGIEAACVMPRERHSAAHK